MAIAEPRVIFAQTLFETNRPVQEQSPVASLLYQRVNASMCAQCHGTNGMSVSGSQIPQLFGQSGESMMQKMKQFKGAEPTSSVMARIARGLSEEQTQSVVNYFASVANSVQSNQK
jgi:cytochrome c553